MDKKKIQQVYEKFIAESLRDHEIWCLRYKPETPEKALFNIEKLELHLSSYKVAFMTNDFYEFEEDGASFIKKYFSYLHLQPNDEVYRILLREYVKAQGYCIKVAIKRMQGIYFDEKICEWMPDHLSEIEGVKTDLSKIFSIIASPDRPSKDWKTIREELYRRHKAGELVNKSRVAISREISEWYNARDVDKVEPETVRKRLKETFDKLGISASG